MKRKVKGFTLIELVVVMAIFSVIMFAALSLLDPSHRIMLSAENSENGAAAVNSITQYLETELSTAEYMTVYGTVLSGTDMDNKVKKFNDTFYRGVLRVKATPDNRKYGEGMVHVLVIDNTNGGQITKYDYKTNFDPLVTNSVSKLPNESWAVNKAYYDSYLFDIIPGKFTSVSEFETKLAAYKTDYMGSLQDELQNISTTNMAFSIMATQRKKCPEHGEIKLSNGSNICPIGHETLKFTGRAFVNVASMTLVNMVDYNTSGGTGRYYVVEDTTDPADGSPVAQIVDRASDVIADPNYPTILDRLQYIPDSDSTDGYTIIYSYAPEQDVKAAP